MTFTALYLPYRYVRSLRIYSTFCTIQRSLQNWIHFENAMGKLHFEHKQKDFRQQAGKAVTFFLIVQGRAFSLVCKQKLTLKTVEVRMEGQPWS